jgi:hypothetical protein
MTEKQGLDKKTIIAELAKSPHGKLTEFLSVGRRAAQEDPDFFAHLVAWNHVKGEVRDAKVALPIIQLAEQYDGQARGLAHLAAVQGKELAFPYIDNALAHLADLNPRSLMKALLPSFEYTEVADKKDPKKKRRVYTLDAQGQKIPVPAFATSARASTRLLRRFVTRYLRDLEVDRRNFERVALQHSRVLLDLYAHFHVSRPGWVGTILFHGEKGKIKELPGGVFAEVRGLKNLGPDEAAHVITSRKIPFIVARGALGKKAQDPAYVLALIKRMSPTELVSNMKWLESVGVKTVPELRAGLEEALGKAATSKRAPAATLKTTRAVQALVEDEPDDATPSKLVAKLNALQEKQLDKLGGIDGDWLVLADKSGSMTHAIDTARQITAIMTRMITGRVHLMFFDDDPYYVEVTGKTLEEITAVTSRVVAGGGTNMYCGIQAAHDRGMYVDGIVFIGDGANHGPAVVPAYRRYCQKMDIEPTLYFYELDGEPDNFSRECKSAGVDLVTFPLRGKKLDYHSLPNLVRTMRVGRYQLIDEVMAMPLRTLDEVLDKTVGMSVLPRPARVFA